LGGGLHSSFGTSKFKTKILNKEDFIEIEEEFGIIVAYYVLLFSTIYRPWTLEKNYNMDGDRIILLDLNCKENIKISINSFTALKAIECSNLEDQSLLNSQQYPNLLEFWNSNEENKYLLNDLEEYINNDYKDLKKQIFNDINEKLNCNNNNMKFYDEEEERLVYKVFEKNEYENNKNEILKMISELRNIGYIYLEVPNVTFF
jgi:hypothetical protein